MTNDLHDYLDPDNIELIGFGGAEKLEKEIDQLLHGKNKDKLE